MQVNSAYYNSGITEESFEEFHYRYALTAFLQERLQPRPSALPTSVADAVMNDIQDLIKGVSRLRISSSSIRHKRVKNYGLAKPARNISKSTIQKFEKVKPKKLQKSASQQVQVCIEQRIQVRSSVTVQAVATPAAATTPAISTKKQVTWAPKADHRQTFKTWFHQQKIDVIDETNRHLSEKILSGRHTSLLVSQPPLTVASLKLRPSF